MGTAYENVLKTLRERGSDVKENGDSATAQCPAHDDDHASLSIGHRRKGDGAVVYCHAGCATADALAKLGLSMRDLFDELDLRDAFATTRDYRYPGGRTNHRSSGPRGGKTFWQDNGGKRDKTLYLGDQLGDPDEVVYVNEGEKAADVMRAAYGVVAVATGGATRPVDWSTLEGRGVVLIGDNDSAGRNWLAKAIEALSPITKSVKVVRAAVDHEHADAADHVAAGYDLDELVEVTEDEGEPIDGAQLFNDVRDIVAKFCVLPGEHEKVAVVLWVALTHLLDKFDYAPRLHIRSPEKRSGKSRLLTVINGLVYSPLPVANCSTAYIYRSVGGDRPSTLLFDEVDALFGSKKAAESNEDLRALINAGVERDAPVGRTVGPNHQPMEFETFAMVALAGIGRLPDTIEDRAVTVAMKRRTKDEKVSQFRRRRDRPRLHTLREELAAWADSVRERAGAEYPDLPIDDRAADVWEPLVAVADLAGGQWTVSARAAAAALSDESAEDDTQSLNVRLLNDIQALFDRGTTDGGPIGSPCRSSGLACSDSPCRFVKSDDLCGQLRRLIESPWRDAELTPSKLGRRLTDNFRIRTRHSSDKTQRGYHLADFVDAFTRYPRPEGVKVSDTPSDQRERGDDLGVSTASPRVSDDSEGAFADIPDAPDTPDPRDTSKDTVETPSGENNNRSSGCVSDTKDTFGHLSGENRAAPDDYYAIECGFYCLDCGTELTAAEAASNGAMYCTEHAKARRSK